VTFTTGAISGFEEDPAQGGPWFKTDTEINPGNSGGSAIDINGNLIGIPTAGIIDPDSAGKIGLLRPINAASEILSGASGLGVPGCDGNTGGDTPIVIDPDGSDILLNFQGFTLAADDDELVTAAPSGIQEVYANFEYIGVSADTSFRSQWFVNGEPMEDSLLEFDEWPLDPGDGFAWINTTNPDGLADGVYTIEIVAGDKSVTSPEFTVGGGSGEVGDTATVIGRVLSADTGRPVRDALFVVLNPEITWDELDTSNPDHILDIAFTDSRGNFQGTFPLPLNQHYSLGVLAEGFEPLLADDVDLNEFEPAGGFVDFGDIGIKAE
jgi:putative serine protease PepD